MAFLGICIGSLFSHAIQPINNLWWVFAFPVAIVGPAFFRARREALSAVITRLSSPDSRLTGLANEFTARFENGVSSIRVGVLTTCILFFMRLCVIWDMPILLYNRSLHLLTFIYCVGIGLLAQTIWIMLEYGVFINRLCIELEITQKTTFSWELLESLGRGYAQTSLGAAVLSVTILDMVVRGNMRLFLINWSSINSQIIFMELVFGAAVVTPFVYLLRPQWRLHNILVFRKEEIRTIFSKRFHEAERAFLTDPGSDNVDRYLAARHTFEEIEKLPEWPFRFESIAPMLSVFILPVVLFLLKEVLVDVIVNLIKK
ncbi:MAG: hypothetical protein HQM09_23255 [Candidatus Riflebacteria bacterium]|nr:hypothetical protein [Candidatus Riflebacteria bacterium]